MKKQLPYLFVIMLYFDQHKRFIATRASALGLPNLNKVLELNKLNN